MAKKRRKKHRRSRSNPKKRAMKRRKHRRNAAPRHRRRALRRKHRNPRRRRARRNPKHRVRGHFSQRKGRGRVRVRAHMSNPKKRHFRRRRSRRNPGGFFGDLALAILAGVGGFVGTFVIGYFITPAAQMVAQGQMYRGGVGLAGAAAGAYVAKKHPLAGAALAVGSLLGAFGGFLTLQVLKFLPAKSTPAQTTTTKGLGAVFQNNLSGYKQLQGYQQQLGEVSGYQQQLGAVFQNNMGAVFQNNLRGMGDSSEGTFVPGAPWNTRTPFDAPAGY